MSTELELDSRLACAKRHRDEKYDKIQEYLKDDIDSRHHRYAREWWNYYNGQVHLLEDLMKL